MTGELLTVKEYAASRGITEQAAYKQIRAGKLQTLDVLEKGNTKKFVFCPFDKKASEAAADPQPASDAETMQELPRNPLQDRIDVVYADLTAQIKEKDAQLREKDIQINRLLELLFQSQQLQSHSQKLLEQEKQQPEPMPVEETKQPRKKHSFWEWLASL